MTPAVKTKRYNTGEETVAVSFRIAKRCSKALDGIIRQMPYPPSKSSLIDRAIDLLVADMRAKGEIK